LLPWLAGWLVLQGVAATAGALVARRKDEGDDSTAGIRRVRVMSGVQLRPHNPELSRVRLDVVMGGGDIDLTGLPKVPGGVDVTVWAVMGGAGIRVPPTWQVWWDFSGAAGGIGAGSGVRRTTDERGADLRVHAHAVFGGVSIAAGAA
jgi:hypothetical protein